MHESRLGAGWAVLACMHARLVLPICEMQFNLFASAISTASSCCMLRARAPWSQHKSTAWPALNSMLTLTPGSGMP
jgi:hypothetical protein